MKQRNQIEATVAARELPVPTYVLRGGDQVAVSEGHGFRARGRTGSLQHQCNIVRLAEERGGKAARFGTSERKEARFCLGQRDQLQDGQAQFLGRVPYGGVQPGG